MKQQDRDTFGSNNEWKYVLSHIALVLAWVLIILSPIIALCLV